MELKLSLKLFSIVSVLGLHSSLAATVDGVEMPDKIVVDKSQFILNGAGTRKATLFKVKVYVAGLYLEAPSKDPEAIISSNQTKQIEMKFVHDVPADKLVQAWSEGFEKNCNEKCEQLKPALVKMNSLMSDVSKGDKLTLTLYPKYVLVSIKDKPVEKIDGEGYSQVLLRTWLGPNPPNKELKNGMLGLN